MNIQHQNFIGIYSDVYPSGFCDYIIKLTEESVQNGTGYTRLASEGVPGHRKQDLALSGHNLHGTFKEKNIKDIFMEGLQQCFIQYTNNFSILKDVRLHSYDMKIQKTGPGEGYHVWHFEQGSEEHTSRCLVFILYLNSLNPENAGETEFLYQQKRILPKENTMVFWPAAFTHTHRGNPVHGDVNKYIITGWFNIS